jgi:glycosyltransferase involved in cell wall biosynthesis
VLKLAARRAGATQARGLEELTLSVLRGEEGQQARELDDLVAWLADHVRPDIVHLSNALLLGLARRIRRDLRIPVVCSLQDEDTWLNGMEPAASRRCWETMAGRAREVDAFSAVSRYYAEAVQDRLGIAAGRLHVVPLGIDVEGYVAAPADPPSPPVIGYLSRLSESLGLGILVDAFTRLKRMSGLEHVRLRAAGGQIGRDARFVARLKAALSAAGMARDADFVDAIERDARLSFLRSLSVLSVPVPGGEAFGAYQLEAMAAGVPVVQPRAGAFPEVVEATGGGILFEPNTPAVLAEALAGLLRDPARRRRLGETGRRAVFAEFTIEKMARRTLAIYHSLL